MSEKRIKCISDEDHKMFKMLRHCGNASTASLKEIGLSATRIENMKRDNLIAQVDKNEKYAHKNDNALWALTSIGKEFARNNCFLEKFECGTNAIKHNAALAEIYCKISKREDVVAIMDEHETRAFVEEKIKNLERNLEMYSKGFELEDKLEKGKMSMPDLTLITNSGAIECYEVLTKNYGAEEISAKESTVEFLEAEYKTTTI